MTEPDVDTAWRILEGKFRSSQPSRWISGCAIHFNVANDNGRLLEARGLVDLKLPLPLLLEHDPAKPCGKVTRVQIVDDEVRFVAEIVNDDAFHLAQVWHDVILSRAAIGISATTRGLRKFSIEWRLEELSLVGSPADAGAYVDRAWERLPYVSLTESAVTVLRC